MQTFNSQKLIESAYSWPVRTLIGIAIFVSCIAADPTAGFKRLNPSAAENQLSNDSSAMLQRSNSPVPAILMDDGLDAASFNQTAKLIASDGADFDQFGFSVSISGNTAVVSADRDDNYRGSVYVFIRNGSSWELQQKLTGLDSIAEDSFGWSVAISGETIIVGAYLDDIEAVTDQGSAYVYTRNGNTWSQVQKITASDGVANDQFGISVAIADDSLVVGAFGNEGYRGSGYVFRRTGSVWNEEQKLIASDRNIDDEFGWSVAISNETVIVGANRDNSNRGSAYVYLRNGSVWTQQQKLIAADGEASDRFGYSVGISGESAIVGAVLDDVGGTLRGSAYVFIRDATIWAQQQKLNASDGAANDKFGGSVAISGDSVVIGANGVDNGTNFDQGAGYIFARSGTLWTEQQKILASDGATGDNFGGSVAINNEVFIIGGYLDDGANTSDQGSAYIFAAATSVTPTPTPTPTPLAGFEGDIAARPNGDGFVLSNDVTQIRRFIVGLDEFDGTTNEFQRADIAPRATLGDGSVDSVDAIQARRYVAGIDPLQVAGGPNQPTASYKGFLSILDDIYEYFVNREIKIVSEAIPRNGVATIFVVTETNENETGISFTLDFDASRLSNPRVTLGDTVSENSVLTVNSDKVRGGIIGILIEAGSSLGSGKTTKLLKIDFDLMSNRTAGQTIVRFSDKLAKTKLSDQFGNPIRAKFIDGTINISGSNRLSGMVTTSDGLRLRNAIVTLMDATGETRSTNTGLFGYYELDELITGRKYNLQVF